LARRKSTEKIRPKEPLPGTGDPAGLLCPAEIFPAIRVYF
jgi:hypothetical protein